jgi:hypothetical protein
MWNAVAHLAGPTLLTAAIAVLGTSVRAAFRYPHMWHYLEFRSRRGSCRSGGAPHHDRSAYIPGHQQRLKRSGRNRVVSPKVLDTGLLTSTSNTASRRPNPGDSDSPSFSL